MEAIQKTGRKKDGLLSAIGALGMYMPIFAMSVLTPAIAYLAAEYYPDLPYSTVTMLMTIEGIAVVPGALLAGALAGKKFKFKPIVVIGILIAAICGPITYFNHAFWFALVTRALMGFGVGMVQPLMDAIVLRLFKGRRGTTVQGLGNALMMIMGIVYQAVSAAAISIDLDYVWLVYLIFFVPLILVLVFLPEPDPVKHAEQPAAISEGGEAKNTAAPKKSGRMPGMVWIMCIMTAVWQMLFYIVVVTPSGIVMAENLGGPAESALIGSLYTTGGIVGALLYSKLYNATDGKAFWPIVLACCTIGVGIYGFGHSIIALCIGSVLVGISVTTVLPGVPKWLFDRIGPERVTMATGWFRAISNIGGFLTSPLMTVIAIASGNPDLRIAVLCGFVGLIVLTIVWTIYTRAKHNDLYKGDDIVEAAAA